jgi:hypothetical protein
MTDIFNEVDEEVRRSRMEALWKRYGALIIVACVALVAAVAAWRYFEWRRETAAADAGTRFEQAVQLIRTGKATEGEAALANIVKEGAAPYKILADLRLASETAKKDVKAAIAAYDRIAADAQAAAQFRDIARLRSVILGADVLPFAEVEQKAQALVGAASPFRHAVQEILAAAAVKGNELEKARTLLDGLIVDRETPPAIKARAELLIGLTRGAK